MKMGSNIASYARSETVSKPLISVDTYFSFKFLPFWNGTCIHNNAHFLKMRTRDMSYYYNTLMTQHHRL